METISLLHPFSAQAIGLREEDLLFSHSKPHEKTLAQLQDEGYEVGISYFTGYLFPYKKIVNGIHKSFWPVTKPILKNRHSWRRQYSLWQYQRYYFNAPDLSIINMSGHGSRYVFDLARLLKRRRKNYVAMIGGVHMSKTDEAINYYQNAHHILVHTEIQKKALMDIEGLRNCDIRVMPLGVDTDVFKPTDRFDATKELLFVGRISRLKRIELCLETLAFLKKNNLNDVTLKIVGPISDSNYHQELLDIAERLEISEMVEFVGSIEQGDLVPYYQKAALLMLPSEHESFGMVMVEAMACGTPVAAIKGSGGPDEIIENEINGLLCDEQDLFKNILEYYSSSSRQIKMREAARRSVEANWSIAATVNVFRKSVQDVFS